MCQLSQGEFVAAPGRPGKGLRGVAQLRLTHPQANVTCTPSTPAPARKRRRPNQDLQERLARCEELLKEYATAKPDSPPPTKAASPRSDRIPELEDPLPKWKSAGKLVEEDGGVRFMDSYLLGTVCDEVNHLTPPPPVHACSHP